MRRVILFGGGDGGGLIITENGVRPIPPFDPPILLNLKSAAAIVNAVNVARVETTRGKMAKLATSLCNLAVEQVEEVVGPLDADASLIYQDEDGGFTCGSTGKPPIPLPWPPPRMPSVPDLLAAGAIETDLLDYVQKARESEATFADMFEKPAELAEKLGVKLSRKSVGDLQLFAPSKRKDIKDDIDREIVDFFQKVVEDGRYLESWFSRPYETARALEVELSAGALEKLATSGASLAFAGLGGENPRVCAVGIMIGIIGVAILLGLVVVWAFTSRPNDNINDRSGIFKV